MKILRTASLGAKFTGSYEMKECIGSGRDKLTSQHYDECVTTVLMLRYRYI